MREILDGSSVILAKPLEGGVNAQDLVQTQVSVLPLITDKQIQNTRRSQVFSTSLSVFRNLRMNTFECLNLLLKLIDILGLPKSRLKLASPMPLCNVLS